MSFLMATSSFASTTECFDKEKTFMLLEGIVITIGSVHFRRPASRTTSARKHRRSWWILSP